MRVGLIGYGAWGRFHARALQGLPGIGLVAVYAHGDASAAAASSGLPGVRVHRSLAALLADGLDAVDIVAPNHLHAGLAVAALEAGCHVLLEKPLATTLEDCDRVIAAARAAGRQVSLTHEMRASPQWGRIGREIADGAIGRPRFASFTLFRHPFRPGAGGWRHDRARVGSWLLEEPVHFFDLLLWYFAASGDPAAIRAFAGTGEGMAENVTATVRYADGAGFVVTQMLGGFGHHCAMEVCGTGGAVRSWWSAETARSARPVFALTLQRGGAPPEALEVPESGEAFELGAQLRAGLDAFRAGRSALPPEEARRAVALCLAAEDSCRTGAEVPLRL